MHLSARAFQQIDSTPLPTQHEVRCFSFVVSERILEPTKTKTKVMKTKKLIQFYNEDALRPQLAFLGAIAENFAPACQRPVDAPTALVRTTDWQPYPGQLRFTSPIRAIGAQRAKMV